MEEAAECTAEEWAETTRRVKNASAVLAHTRDVKGCWDLLATLFEVPFFELINLPVPYALQTPREARESTVRHRRLIAELPDQLQQELVDIDETLRRHDQLVEAHKATAREAVKRRRLVYEEAILVTQEAKLRAQRQILETKRRRTDTVQAQVNTVPEPVSVPQASGSRVTTRQSLVTEAYKRVPQESATPAGISPLLKLAATLSKELAPTEVVAVHTSSPVKPDVHRRTTRSAVRIVPPAPERAQQLWKAGVGTIQPKPPVTDLAKHPFTKDGKTLRPVLERATIQGKCKNTFALKIISNTYLYRHHPTSQPRW